MRGLLLKMLLLFLLFLSLSDIAFGYPSNFRQGYPQCESCHVNPTGGGALTQYGQGTASSQSAFGALFGNEKGSKYFHKGGDIRHIWQEKCSGSECSKNNFMMAADIELGAQYKGFGVTAQAGSYYAGRGTIEGSNKHYVFLKRPGYSLQYGRFSPAFGYYSDDHTLPGRNSLGFRHGFLGSQVTLYGNKGQLSFFHSDGCTNTYQWDDKYCKDKQTVGGFKYQYMIKNSFQMAFSKAIFADHVSGAYDFIAGNKMFWVAGEYAQKDFIKSDVEERQGWLEAMWEPTTGVSFGPQVRSDQRSKTIGFVTNLRLISGFNAKIMYHRVLVQDDLSTQFFLLTHFYL